MAKKVQRANAKPVAVKASQKAAPVSKKISAPRATRTIQETVAVAKVDQPSAGKQRLPRANRRKAVAKKSAKKAQAARPRKN